MEIDQYQRQSECEDYQDYGPEGYHPVVLGQRFNGKYTVHQKLGWGHFSTVWLASNDISGQYGALKIQKSKQSYCESAQDELQMLQQIQKHENDRQWIEFRKEMSEKHPKLVSEKLCRPLSLLDNFVYHGIHGKHYCSVFELMGPNLLDLIQHFEFKDKRMPMWLVKKITIDVLMGLVHLHEFCQIIHTDLKPQNIMMKLHPEQEIELIQRIKQYKVKPISMKYLKNIQSSKNSKSKKKNQKKKLKKKQQKENETNGETKQEPEDSGQMDSELTEKKQESAEQQDSNMKSAELVPQNSDLIAEESNLQTPNQSNVEIALKENASGEQSILDKMHETEEKVKNDKQEEQIGISILKWKNMDIKLNTDVFFKIADMGNACFINKHYTDNIQTREYRSPEVILGHSYYPNTDIWSLACTIFEMMTNNFLFKPKRISGISKDEDHLYKIIEVLGPMPKEFAVEGSQSAKVFNKKGKLLHGHPSQQLPIRTLLHEDFGYDQQEAIEIQNFLTPMLQYCPKDRISARECLKNQWLWK